MGTTVTLRHIEGMRFVGETENHAIVLESGYLGTQKGASPMEAFLLALGGCTGMDVMAILMKMKQPPKKFAVKINGERAEEYPKVYTKVKITYILEGVEFEKAEKAVKLSQDRYCPLSAMLKRSGCEITYEIITSS